MLKYFQFFIMNHFYQLNHFYQAHLLEPDLLELERELLEPDLLDPELERELEPDLEPDEPDLEPDEPDLEREPEEPDLEPEEPDLEPDDLDPDDPEERELEPDLEPEDFEPDEFDDLEPEREFLRDERLLDSEPHSDSKYLLPLPREFDPEPDERDDLLERDLEGFLSEFVLDLLERPLDSLPKSDPPLSSFFEPSSSIL